MPCMLNGASRKVGMEEGMEPMGIVAAIAIALVTAMNSIDIYLTQRRVAELEKAVEKAEDAAYRRRRGDDGLHR